MASAAFIASDNGTIVDVRPDSKVAGSVVAELLAKAQTEAPAIEVKQEVTLVDRVLDYIENNFGVKAAAKALAKQHDEKPGVAFTADEAGLYITHNGLESTVGLQGTPGSSPNPDPASGCQCETCKKVRAANV